MSLKFKWETDFKETKIGEIPKDWGLESLEWATKSLESGNRPKGGSLKHDPKGVLSIGGENITWQGDLILNECLRFKKDFYESLNRGKIEKDDILLVKDGATIGKLVFIKEIPEGKAMVNEHVFLIKTNKEKYNPRFLFYYLFSDAGQMLIESAIGGSAQGGINRNIINIVKIPKIEITEQSRIATVLSWFNDLIENKKQQNEILKKTAMAIFKSWFIDFEPFKKVEFVDSEFGKIPKLWNIKHLDKVIKILYGKGLPEKNRKEGSYPVVGSSGIVGYHSQYLVRAPSIVIGRKGNAGSVQLLLEPSFPIDTVFYTSETSNHETIFYIYHYLKNASLEDVGISDTAVPGLNIHILNSLNIIVPDTPDLKKFQNLVYPLYEKTLINQKQITILRNIRDTLLPLLVFGRLRVEEI